MSKDKWTILLVDDEESVHDNLEMYLRDMVHADKGVQFLSAFSAEEAKEIVKKHDGIAVIILDVMMETDDAGLGFIEYLREKVGNKETRVILYTGQSGIAPKREVSQKYVIDGYVDKNRSNGKDDDCYVAVLLALKAYEYRIKTRKLIKKDDVSLLAEIARSYSWLLADPKVPRKYKEVVEKVNSMIHLSQELLAGYALEDLKEGVEVGTAKTLRLSRKEYDAIVAIRNIKIQLASATATSYEREKTIFFDAIAREAKRFATISILSDPAKTSLDACLKNVAS